MQLNFTIDDSLVLILYLLITVGIGFYYSKGDEKTLEGYFLGNRSFGWFSIGLAIFATNISSEHFIGLAGSGASRGLAVGQFELMAIFTLVLLGWFFAPIYHNSGVLTVPEFMEKRFDARIRKVLAIFSIVLYIFTKITLSLVAGGFLFNILFGISIYNSAILLVLITGIYTIIGGMRAIVKTQIFQAIVLIVAATVMTIYSLSAAGGISGITSNLSSDYFTMFKPINDPDYPWTGIVFGAPIVAFWYWCTDQYMVQKTMAARSIDQSRKGTLFAAVLKILPIFILVVPGLAAKSINPAVNGDNAFPFLMMSNILPVGIKGLVIAGVLAAVMSSLAASFNSVAALFTNDIYKTFNPEASERKLVLIGRLASLTVVIIAILLVPMTKLVNSEMYIYLQSLQAYVAASVTAIFLLGFFVQSISSRAVFYSFIIGEAIGLGRFALDMLRLSDTQLPYVFAMIAEINFLHFSIILFIATVVMLYGFSFAFKDVVKKTTDTPLTIPSFHRVNKFSLNMRGELTANRTNILLSAFLFLFIIGLWTLWY